MKRIIAIAIVVSIFSVGLVGFVGNRRHQGKSPMSEIQKMKTVAKVVKAWYTKVCTSEEATVIAAALAIHEVGKKTDIDSAAKLEGLLKKTKKQSLRNFLRFLIAESYKERKKAKPMVDQLVELAEENLQVMNKKDSRENKEEKKSVKEKKD